MSLSSISPELIWAIVGIVLICCEFLMPGLVIAFFGVGALITALATWMFSPSLAVQLVIFLVSSLALLFTLRKFVKNTFLGDEKVGADATDYNLVIGKIVPVIEFIQPGEVGGRVKYQGTPWSASSEEPCAPGDSVKIIGSNNLTLLVEKVDKINEEEK